MTGIALLFAGPVALPRPSDTATAPTKPRPKGPVLIGDLSTSLGGRPLFLMHWDAPDDPD